jgi:ribosomal protein L11 methyltransferase
MLAPFLARCTHARGKVVLSGILQDQADDVNAAYREWFDIKVTAQQDGWVLLAGVKR